MHRTDMNQAQAKHTYSNILQTLVQALKKNAGITILLFFSLYLKLISMFVSMALSRLLISVPSRRGVTFGPCGAHPAEGRACPMGQG